MYVEGCICTPIELYHSNSAYLPFDMLLIGGYESARIDTPIKNGIFIGRITRLEQLMIAGQGRKPWLKFIQSNHPLVHYFRSQHIGEITTRHLYAFRCGRKMSDQLYMTKLRNVERMCPNPKP